MSQRIQAFSLALLLVAAGAAGIAEAQTEDGEGKGRRLLDVEAAVGAIVAVDNSKPVDDNLLYGGSVAIRLIDRIDGELGFLVGDTKDRDDEEHRLVKYLYGGFRYYPYFDVEGAARPYLLVGVSEFWDLEDEDDSDTGIFLAPGIRFQPGEHIGFTVKLPIVVAVTGGDANTMLLPNFNLYWQFDLPGNGSEAN